MSAIKNDNVAATAENFAADFLSTRGYLVLHRNWRRPACEVDIIARCQKTKAIHFFEVKYRCSDGCGGGIEAIDADKIRRLKRAVDRYSQENRSDDDYEIGIIALSGNGRQIDYINEALDL